MNFLFMPFLSLDIFKYSLCIVYMYSVYIWFILILKSEYLSPPKLLSILPNFLLHLISYVSLINKSLEFGWFGAIKDIALLFFNYYNKYWKKYKYNL